MPQKRHDIPVSLAARQLDKTSQTLRNWCRRYRIGYRRYGRWYVKTGAYHYLQRGYSPQEASRHA